MQLRQPSPDPLVSFSDFLLERFGLVASMQVAVVGSIAFHLFLIVGLVWPAVAAVLALTGKQKLAEARMPEQTVQEVKEDAQWVRQQRS